MADENSVARMVLTPDGKRKLEEELTYLKNVKRDEIAHEIEVARSFGDLSENAEYDEAKNAQARVEGRIRDIDEILRNAIVADANTREEGVVSVGSIVKVFDMEYEEEDEYTVVGATEADPKKLFVSTESPIGKALMGARHGDVVEAQTPGGSLKLKVLEIKHRR